MLYATCKRNKTCLLAHCFRTFTPRRYLTPFCYPVSALDLQTRLARAQQPESGLHQKANLTTTDDLQSVEANRALAIHYHVERSTVAYQPHAQCVSCPSPRPGIVQTICVGSSCGNWPTSGPETNEECSYRCTRLCNSMQHWSAHLLVSKRRRA